MFTPHFQSKPLRQKLFSFSGYVIGLAMGLLIAGAAPWVHGGDSGNPKEAKQLEYQLKAGFLYNFAKFVQWPSTNAGTTNIVATNDFQIGILDTGQAFQVLNESLTDKQINGRKIKVVAVDNEEEAAACQMLFVSQTPTGHAERILEHVAAAPVLTVGESPDFAKDGGCINLMPQGEQLRFEVNLKAAERAGLKISSKLAAMAVLVKTAAEER